MWIITSSSSLAVDSLLASLGQSFPVKDLGSLSYFFGVELTHLPNGILLSQKKKTFMIYYTRLGWVMPSLSHLPWLPLRIFQNLVSLPLTMLPSSKIDSLQYLSLTRPDISFLVNNVCQLLHAPTLCHWTTIKQIIRYLKFTLTHSLLLFKHFDLTLHAYSDAD